MRLQESGEMYLETIYVLLQKNEKVRSLDVAEQMNFSKPSVSRAVGLLKKEGYLVVDENGYFSLTEQGNNIAASVYERHIVLTKMLLMMGVDEVTASQDACKMEHGISEKSLEAIKKHIERQGFVELLDLMKTRHSIRKYTDETIDQQELNKILQAGMLSPSGKNTRPWEFIVVREKSVLEKMASARSMGAQMLTEADTAIVVVANTDKTDTWIEDCSIAMSNMHLMAHSLGIGSCWIQGRLREAKNGQQTEEFLRSLLGLPANCKLLAILSLGMPNERKKASNLETLPEEKIHWEKY